MKMIYNNIESKIANFSNEFEKKLLDLIQSFSRQALHASTIRFPSLNRDDVYEFKADLPQDIKSLIQLM